MTAPRTRILRSVPALVLFGILVLAFWPVRLGGSASFVIVRGASMEPQFHNGDLLYARRSSSYRVGEVVLLRIPGDRPGAGQFVVHRITAKTDDGRYITRGDNRSSEDDARPAPSDLVAKPMVNLGPVPARLLLLLPYLMALLVAGTLGWLLWPSAKDVPVPLGGPTVADVRQTVGRLRAGHLAVLMVVIAAGGFALRQAAPQSQPSGRPSTELTFTDSTANSRHGATAGDIAPTLDFQPGGDFSVR